MDILKPRDGTWFKSRTSPKLLSMVFFFYYYYFIIVALLRHSK